MIFTRNGNSFSVVPNDQKVFFLNVRKPSTLFHRTKCSASWHDLNWTSTQTIEWNWWEKRNCFASRCEIKTVFRSQSPSTKVKMSLNSMRAAWLVTWLPNYKALTFYTIEHTQKNRSIHIQNVQQCRWKIRCLQFCWWVMTDWQSGLSIANFVFALFYLSKR